MILMPPATTWESLCSSDAQFLELQGHLKKRRQNGTWADYEQMKAVVSRLVESFENASEAYVVAMHHVAKELGV